MAAVYFLGTGITVITLLGAESYVQSLFYGGALIIAVILSQLSHQRASTTKWEIASQFRRILGSKENKVLRATEK